MVGKGGPVSFGNGAAIVAAATSSSPQQTVAKQIVTKSPHSHSEEVKSDSNSSSSLTGTPKQSAVATEAQQPLSNAMKLQQQEEPEKIVRPNAGASPLLDDDENDDLNGSLQQMDSLLTSLHSKEAHLNWMLEAVSTAYEEFLGVVKTNVTNLWFAGDGSAKHALEKAESAREPASRLGFVRRDDT